MSATPKKKLCWNCEGRVSLEEENCPYCAVYLGPAPNEKGGGYDPLAPPYRLVESEEEQEVPPSPYAAHEPTKTGEQSAQEPVELETASSDLKRVVMPVAMLSAGAMFFVFGLILFVFSEEGTFTLTWNGEHWYYYLVFALPMLFLGWRSLQNFEEEEA